MKGNCMRNIKLDLCYDGTRYRGWQRQPGVENTIQGKLETALSRILEEPIEVYGSGRTDAGVHALHQVASFHCESRMPVEEMRKALRHYLPEDIGVIDLKQAGAICIYYDNSCYLVLTTSNHASDSSLLSANAKSVLSINACAVIDYTRVTLDCCHVGASSYKTIRCELLVS